MSDIPQKRNVRQILAHRYQEGQLVDQQLAKIRSDSQDWTNLRDAVNDKIGKHLVTDLEKAAYSFYLPDGYAQQAQTDRTEPSEVVLF